VIKKAQPKAKYNCGLCDFSSDIPDSFQSHIRIHRPKGTSPEDVLQCKECGMCFASEPAWTKHLFLLHRIKRPSPSDYCSDLKTSTSNVTGIPLASTRDPFSFSEGEESGEGELTIDEGAVSFKARTNVCQVCSLAFSTPLELRRHFRSHGMAYLMTAKQK
jgi:uncharacterized C2H2 Zn-finger protein